MKFGMEIYGTKTQLMADFVSMVTISDAPTQLLLKVQNMYVLIHTMQEEPKMAVSVSKRHNAGNCKTDLADLPSFLFYKYFPVFCLL